MLGITALCHTKLNLSCYSITIIKLAKQHNNKPIVTHLLLERLKGLYILAGMYSYREKSEVEQWIVALKEGIVTA